MRVVLCDGSNQLDSCSCSCCRHSLNSSGLGLGVALRILKKEEVETTIHLVNQVRKVSSFGKD